MRRVTILACVVALGCRSEGEKTPPPPPAPVDGIEIVTPGAEPRRELRYDVASGTTTPLELAMDVDLQTADVAVQVPTLSLAIDLSRADARMKVAVAGASVRARSDDPKAASVVAIMDRQAQLLPGLVISFALSPTGAVTDSKLEATNRDLSGPMQEQVATLVQMSEQIAMPLPAAAIGAGAEWKHRRTIKQNQLTLTSVTTVRIKAIEGSRVTFESTSELTGPDQTITQNTETAKVTGVRGTGSASGSFDLATAAMQGTMRAALQFEMVAGDQRRPTRFELVTRIAPRTDAPPSDAGP